MKRSKSSILSRAWNINVSYSMINHLSAEAEIFIQNHYASEGAKYCYEMLDKQYSIALIQKFAHECDLKYESWTDDEILILKNNYISNFNDIEKLIPRHSKSAIIQQAKIKFNLDYPSTINRWTEEEDIILTKIYTASGDLTECQEKLSRWNLKQIQSRIYQLHLKNPNKKIWTEDDTNIMLTYYEIEGPREIQKRLPHWSYCTIISRAKKLGLNVGMEEFGKLVSKGKRKD